MPWYKRKKFKNILIAAAVIYTLQLAAMMLFIPEVKEGFPDEWWKTAAFIVFAYLSNISFYAILFYLIGWIWGFLRRPILKPFKAVGATITEPLNHKRLLQAKELYDAGIYTEEEFKAKIAELKG